MDLQEVTLPEEGTYLQCGGPKPMPVCLQEFPSDNVLHVQECEKQKQTDKQTKAHGICELMNFSWRR